MTRLNNKIINSPFIFYLGLYFLFFICFLGSYLTSVSFLLTLEVNYGGSFIAKILFLIFTCVYLLNPASGKTIYDSLTSAIYLEKVFIFTKKVNSFTTKHPFVAFYLLYFYMLLLILHWFMLLYSGIDIYIELLYNCFNVLRLLLFPLIIYYYILYYGPSSFTVVDLSATFSVEELQKAFKSSANFFKVALQKAHKTTKGTMVITGVGALVGGSAVAHGANVRSQIEETASRPPLSSEIAKLGNDDGMSDPKCQEMLVEIITIFRKKNENGLIISYNDIKAFVNKEPTLSESWDNLTRLIPHLNADAFKKAKAELEARAIQEASTSSPTAIGLSASSQPTEASLEAMPQTSITVLNKATTPGSPLEELWSFF